MNQKKILSKKLPNKNSKFQLMKHHLIQFPILQRIILKRKMPDSDDSFDEVEEEDTEETAEAAAN